MIKTQHYIAGLRLRNEPYLIINIFFAFLIAGIMLYSLIFSPEKNNYPVACIHEKITDQECASCGLSHSFSLILKGRIDEAMEWNANGLRVFLFFIFQFVFRIGFSFAYVLRSRYRQEIIIADSVATSLMLIIAFLPFIRWLFVMMFQS